MPIRKLLYNLPLVVTVDTDLGVVLKVEEDGDAIHAASPSDVWDDHFESIGTDQSEDHEIPAAYEIAEMTEWPARDTLN